MSKSYSNLFKPIPQDLGFIEQRTVLENKEEHQGLKSQEKEVEIIS